jgi:hypothetical protein
VVVLCPISAIGGVILAAFRRVVPIPSGALADQRAIQGHRSEERLALTPHAAQEQQD